MTPAACEKVLSLMQRDNNLNLRFRVYIIGGGCSGFEYGFAFTEEVNADDLEIPQQEQISVVVDALSLQYLVFTSETHGQL